MLRRLEGVAQKRVSRRWAALLLAWVLALPVAGGSQVSNSDCMGCHGERDLKSVNEKGEEISLYVDLNAYRQSVHADLQCVDCHQDVKEIPHAESLPEVQCGRCHEETQAVYDSSSHGLAHKRGDQDAPKCWSCHGKHNILKNTDPAAPTSRMNATRVCLKCHVDEEITARHEDMPQPQTIKMYEKSVHGRRVLEQGLVVAAECIDCHSAHSVFPASDPRSPLYKTKVPQVCGRCHVTIRDQYLRSVHGRAIDSGVLDAPVCTDCHGEHDILAPTDAESKVAPRNVPRTCSSCHDNVALAEKYQLPLRRYETFMESFHGVALKYGETVVANCASCHGVHEILPSTDPRSTINPANLVKTCGKCHPGISEKVALGKVHVEAKPTSSKGKYIVRKFYTYFISILVTLFVLYIIIETISRIRHRRTGSSS